VTSTRKHPCQPPIERRHLGRQLLFAASPKGAFWQCECGQLWRVGKDIQFGNAWFTAGWLTRRKYQRQLVEGQS